MPDRIVLDGSYDGWEFANPHVVAIDESGHLDITVADVNGLNDRFEPLR